MNSVQSFWVHNFLKMYPPYILFVVLDFVLKVAYNRNSGFFPDAILCQSLQVFILSALADHRIAEPPYLITSAGTLQSFGGYGWCSPLCTHGSSGSGYTTLALVSACQNSPGPLRCQCMVSTTQRTTRSS